MKTKYILLSALLLGAIYAPALAATDPKGQASAPADLKIEQPDSGWHHASGKPLLLSVDPLGKHAGKVAEIPADLNMWLLDMKPAEPKDSIAMAFDTYLTGGNIQAAFASSLPGDNQFKGYFIGFDSARNLSLSARMGLTGPWESLGTASTKLPDGWNRLKIVCYKDGTIDVYANDDLYIEKTDKRIPLAPNWINFQSNGDGKKYIANVTFDVK